MHPQLLAITDRIRQRSAPTRADYLARMAAQRAAGTARGRLDCGNLAHAFAAAGADKEILKRALKPNIGIVTAFNDMLSAHQPLEHYPTLIKAIARSAGCTAQVAGGVPAMCDGVTQGQPGMELSLFSRDVIALATAVSLSHNTFDGALLLGVCDKIVPGLLIGALSFGHLPMLFVPGGPMTSGLPNKEKALVRQRYAEGKATRAELLDAESQSYHGAGTCTFYGTANSNQMLLEFMGLMVPGAAFVNPGTPLRDALTVAAAERVCALASARDATGALGELVDERALVNAIVGLAATGGSTNHMIHLVAVARAAGILIDWDDFDGISRITPLLARVYPNGSADVNHLHAAGGLGFLLRELLGAGLLHGELHTVSGRGLALQAHEPRLVEGRLVLVPPPAASRDTDVLRAVATPFADEGGLRLLKGNLGRAVCKISAVAEQHRSILAPARVFDSQDALLAAFKAGHLDQDLVIVVRFQGPQANGMPELHKLTPTLSVLQDRGRKVALLTDGRMSGASGKVFAAIHASPEALDGGPLARLCDGDLIAIDAASGLLEHRVPAVEWETRTAQLPGTGVLHTGLGRELFGGFRKLASSAESGASALL